MLGGGGGEEDEEEAASREGRANAREVYHPVMPLRYPKQPRASPSTRRDSVSSRGRSRVMSTILGMTGGREGRGGGSGRRSAHVGVLFTVAV